MGNPRLPAEFDLIARHFAPLAAGRPGALGLADDAAFLDLAAGERLVVTADALVAGVHFLSDDPPQLVARKMLRVNLSDLAAKGARPLAYFMTAALPATIGEPWIAAFAGGLAADQAEFGVALMGGDTVATPGPLTLSVTALGTVAPGRELRRGGALAGDAVLVSGSIGDAAFGLLALHGGLPTLPAGDRAALIDRYRLPQPRMALGPALSAAGLAHAAIDVSDGLVADLGHVCATSGLSAVLEAARVPLSAAAAAAIASTPALLATAITGGDDYEMLFTAAPADIPELSALATRIGVPVAVVGRIVPGEGVRVEDATGMPMTFAARGYQHRW